MNAEKRANLHLKFLSEVVPLESGLGASLANAVKFRCILTDESDRGCALMAAAHLDDLVFQLIRAKLLDDKKIAKTMLSGDGPISAFSARIDLAFLLGLITPDARRELHILRKIRNIFAHDPDNFGFEKEEIKSRCDELKYVTVQGDSGPREKFTNAMMGIAGHILITISDIEQIRPLENIDLIAHKERCKSFTKKHEENILVELPKVDIKERMERINAIFQELVRRIKPVEKDDT